MKLYISILAISSILGLAIFAATPEQAVAGPGGCGSPPCRVEECCNGQGSCSTGYQEYGVCMYRPSACTEVCDFDFSGCMLEHLC